MYYFNGAPEATKTIISDMINRQSKATSKPSGPPGHYINEKED